MPRPELPWAARGATHHPTHTHTHTYTHAAHAHTPADTRVPLSSTGQRGRHRAPLVVLRRRARPRRAPLHQVHLDGRVGPGRAHPDPAPPLRHGDGGRRDLQAHQQGCARTRPRHAACTFSNQRAAKYGKRSTWTLLHLPSQGLAPSLPRRATSRSRRPASASPPPRSLSPT